MQPAMPASITPVETITVDERVVSCDGGLAPLGHPRVWLRIEGTEVMCPYCSRRYVLAAGTRRGGHH